MAAAVTERDFPLRLGSAEQFACVRRFLQNAAFDDSTLCRTLGIGAMSDLGRVQWDKVPLDSLSAPLRWCIRVLARGLATTPEECRQACGEETFDACVSLGLLRRAGTDSAGVVCPVWAYPADGFVIVSDRRDDSEGKPYTPPPDVVFPAIYAGTLRFLRLLPETPGGEALDLCGGSGIGALHLCRTTRTAETADVTERAALFAEFNARLNDAPVRSLCGDLYAPVSGRKFDLISAHPPFVPTAGETMIYRDGGPVGEEVTRRVIEGLPAHLRLGGSSVILCVARDTPEQPFEQRARAWLGSARDEFDLVFGLEKILSVDEVVESMRKRGQQFSEAEAHRLDARLRSLGTRRFVYGALFLHRWGGPVAQPPLRVHLTSAGGAKDFERLLAWRQHCRQPDFNRWLAESRPRLATGLELTVRHVVEEGQLVPAEFVFSIETGFQVGLRLDGWVVPLVARLEGKRSLEVVFEAARKADELPEGFTLEAFGELVRTMIEKGLLEVDFPR